VVFRQVFRVYHAAFSGLPRDVWLLSFVSLVNRSGTMVLPFIGLYITEDRGMSVTAAGRMLAVYGIGSTIGSYIGGWLADHIGAQRSQLFSLIGTGAGFIWLSQLESPTAITVAILLVSIVAESFRPANMTAMAQRAPEAVQVRSFALLRLAANLGMGIGPAVGGVLALYSYTWLFLADAATCWLAALLFALLLTEPDERDEEGRAQSDGSPWTDGPFVLLTLLVTVLALTFFQVFSTLPLYFRQVLGYRENVIGLLLGFNALLIALDAPIFFPIIWGFFSLLILLGTLDLWFEHRTIEVHPEHLVLTGGILGLGKTHEIQRSAIRGIKPIRGMQAGNKLFYRIQITTVDDKKHIAATKLDSLSLARHVIDLLAW